MNKQALVQALLALMKEDLARATESANRTRQGAIHEEARPENDKDTRALEASYLARGQAQRVVDLEAEIKRVAFMELTDFTADRAVDLSALVKIESDDETPRWVFLCTAGGGRQLTWEGESVDVLTPEAPLGRALIGQHKGDDLQLRIGSRLRDFSVTEVR